jgi:hypothetical protein
MARVTRKIIPAMLASITVLVPCRAQDLTPEERWSSELAVYHSTPIWYEKMPVDVALPASIEDIKDWYASVSQEKKSLAPADPYCLSCQPASSNPRIQFELDYSRGMKAPSASVPPMSTALPEMLTVPRVVSSDSMEQEAAPLRVHLAQVVTGQPRALVSLSPGLNIGRGVWSWRGTACNVTDFPQHIDQGDIEEAANSLSIPTIGFGEAQNSNQLFINRSHPVVATQVVQTLTGLGTLLIASRIVAASGIWGAAFGGATYAAGALVSYYKSVTPADVATRFAGTTILVDGYSATLTPRSQPNHCASWEFFARYSGKGAVARSGLPIY